MGQRRSAAEWAAEADGHRYCVEERRALPRTVTEGLLEVLAGEASPDEREAVLTRITVYRDRSLRRLELLLRVLDSAAALEMKALELAIEHSDAARYASRAGFNRFHWILAVSGKGSDRSPDNIQKYAAACGAWLATSEIIGRLNPVDEDLAHGLQVNPRLESARRTSAVVVYFRWASELFCKSMAAEIQSNEDKYRALNFVTPRAVGDLFKWVEAYIDRLDRTVAGETVGPPPVLSAHAVPLVESLTVSGDDYRPKSFAALASTLDIEAYPFVRVRGTIAPVAVREATYGVELAVLNLARRLLMNDKDRSDLFENAVKRSLSKVLPSEIEVPYGSISIPIVGTKNKGETDFIFRDPQRVLSSANARPWLRRRRLARLFMPSASKSARLRLS